MLRVLKELSDEICCGYLKNRPMRCYGYSKELSVKVVGNQKKRLDEICCRYSKEPSR